MLGSPKVILELSGVHFGFFEGHFWTSESDFCHLESIRCSGVCFPRIFGIFFSLKLMLATTDMFLCT